MQVTINFNDGSTPKTTTTDQTIDEITTMLNSSTFAAIGNNIFRTMLISSIEGES